jgi:hypothetical protein
MEKLKKVKFCTRSSCIVSFTSTFHSSNLEYDCGKCCRQRFFQMHLLRKSSSCNNWLVGFPIRNRHILNLNKLVNF